MNFVKCNACPSSADCAEDGKCLNTLVTHAYGRSNHISINSPALAAHPVAQANAASWPTGAPRRAQAAPAASSQGPGTTGPGGRAAVGSVDRVVFAECDAVLADLNAKRGDADSRCAAVDQQVRRDARNMALTAIVAKGVNINSARKASLKWVAARQ